MKRILSTLILSAFASTMLTGALFVPDKAELGVAKNYISNGGIERGKVGFATYKDTAGVTPVDGTGGSPTHITISASTSSPLKDSTSLNIINSGSTSAQGEGSSYDFSIDSGDQTSVINVSFDYSLVSGTFVSGSIIGSTITDSDLEIYIYDVTNALVIQPSGYILTCGSVVASKCTNPAIQFQSASNSTSYRLIFHVATASTSAWTMKVDNIVASRLTKQYGAPLTAWVNLGTIPFATAGGTAATKGTVVTDRILGMRVGGKLRLRYEFEQSVGGTGGSGTQLLGLPAGYVIDTALISSDATDDTSGTGDTARTSSKATVGTGYLVEPNNAVHGPLVLHVYDSTHINGIYNYNNTAYIKWPNTASNGAFANRLGFTFEIEVPIVGWSSNVQMSDSADTRVLASAAVGATASVTSSYSDVTWTTVNNDTHAAFNASSSATTWTAPISGFYNFNGQLFVSATTITAGNNYVIGLLNNTTSTTLRETTWDYEGINTGSTAIAFNYRSIFLTAGTVIKIQVKSTATAPVITSSTTQNFLSVARDSGPATIAASETVNVRYHNTATSISGSLATISWTTSDFDSHNGMSAGTYTVPSTGKYHASTCIAFSAASAAAGNAIDVQIQKNGSAFSEMAPVYQSTQVSLPVCFGDDINASAGDTIRVQASSAATTPTITSSNTKNFFSISKVGN